ncbi:MAG: TonB-dependent receptor [Robiginitomaculum sp.]|nr:TonB-dependent receptor [Robiginitomaculum sp.]
MTRTVNKNITNVSMSLALALSLSAGSHSVMAQASVGADQSKDQIVVTARKREENLFEAPLAISVVTPDILERNNIKRLDDVGKYVPNLTISRYGVGNTSQAAVFIRGIGLQDHIITTDPGVGVYLDGIYLGRQMGSNLSLNNIERLEVLRGPQGTLYGRNTLGGAINIITKQPGSDNGYSTSVKLGTRGRVAVDFYGNHALSDEFAVALSGGYKRRDGVGDFLLLQNPEARVGEEEEFNARLTAKWSPNSDFSVNFSLDGVSANNGQSPYYVDIHPSVPRPDSTNPFDGGFPLLNQGLLAADRDDSNSTVAGLESTSNEGFGVSVTVDMALSENWDAKVLGSYRSSTYTGGLDDDESALRLSEFPENGNAQQTSLELQLNGSWDRADFVGGVYYFKEIGETESGPFVFSPFNSPNAVEGFGGLGFFDLNQTAESFAIFGNASFQVSDRFKVGAGIRYSDDNKDADALFPTFATRSEVSDSWSAVTWDVNASYEVADNLFAYAQIQRGYQTGGFPPRPFGGSAQFVSFDETTSINYEIGIKGKLGENLTVLTSAFWTEYSDLALPFSDPTAGGGFVTIIENAGQSRARGIEIEGTLDIGNGFSINSSLGYLDAEITEVRAGTIGIGIGDTPALTPNFTFSISPELVSELDSGNTIITSVNYSYRSSMFGQSINRAGEEIAGRGLLGFNITYDNIDGNWALGIYGENVTNKIYDVGRLQQNGFVGVVASNDRSEFGVRFTKRFGR